MKRGILLFVAVSLLTINNLSAVEMIKGTCRSMGVTVAE